MQLRRALGGDAIVTASGTYRLAVPDDDVDLACFEHAVGHARETLAVGHADRAAHEAADALALWRGPPFAELGDWAPAVAEATRLEGVREQAEDLYLEAMIGAGRAGEITEVAGRLAERAPFREGRWVLLARALYVAGRQADALAAVARLRAVLRTELGIDPSPAVTDLERAILLQDRALDVLPAVDPAGPCPWPGLLAYQPEDAETFFGREDDILGCLTRLEKVGALVVAGVSGSGKSSLVRAGVVPRLGAARVITPGPHPRDALGDIDPGTALVVDQAEEAVTLCSDRVEAGEFFQRLSQHTAQVIVVTRSDHLEALSAFDGFVAILERALFIVRPLDEPGLREVIEGPSRQAGIRLEPGLVELLVRDCGGELAALPLLSHVLVATWQRLEGNTLTVAGYRDSGGVREAVARTAEGVYAGLDPQDRRRVRALFLRLVTNDGGDPVRLTVPRSTVPDHAIVDRLVAERLLGLTENGDLQLAHEALAQHWPRLIRWLDEDRDGQRVLRHLSAEAVEWDRLGRAPEALYRGIRLDTALEWADTHDHDLTDLEREFLEVSQAHADEELRRTCDLLATQRRAYSRLRLALGAVAILLVAAVVASVVSLHQTGTARVARDLAQAAELRSEALRIGAIAETARNPTVAFALAAQGLSMDDSEASRRHALEVFAHFPGLVTSDPSPRSTEGLVLGDSVALGPFHGRRIEIDATRSRVTSLDGPSGARVATSVVEGMTSTAPGPGFAALSPDGRTLAVATAVEIELRDARTLASLWGIPVPSRPNALAFSPDSRSLAWGLSEDGFVDEGTTVVHDLVGRREVMRVKNSDEAVWAHAFSRDGGLVTALGPDGTRTWALRPIRGVIRNNQGEVVAFRMDATLISPWDDSVTQWIAEACRLAGRGLTSQEWRESLGATPATPAC